MSASASNNRQLSRGRIALKVDVDTCRGALLGIPRLLERLSHHQAAATFFFSLGPDCSGRESRQGALSRYYDPATRFSGVILPGPDIGVRAVAALRSVRSSGFEVAVHAWNRTDWEKHILHAENGWVETQMALAWRRFEAVFGEPPQAHGAAGWRMNRHALRLTQRLGFAYASDCRGTHPFLPVIAGEIVRCPQIPTTLPTLDERFRLGARSVAQAAQEILETADAACGDHVFTLRAELEGMRFPDALDLLLGSWRERGYALVSVREILAGCNLAQLPCHEVVYAEVPGRKAVCLVQGGAFLGS